MSPCAREVQVPCGWERCGTHAQLLQESAWDFLPREPRGDREQRGDVV